VMSLKTVDFWFSCVYMSDFTVNICCWMSFVLRSLLIAKELLMIL
jgi:hypothetical protein